MNPVMQSKWTLLAILIFFITIESKSQVLGCDGKPFDPSIKYGVYRMDFKPSGLIPVPALASGAPTVISFPFAQYGANAVDPTPKSGLITEVRLGDGSFQALSGSGFMPIFICISVDGTDLFFQLNTTLRERDYYRLPLGDGIKFCKSMFISVAAKPISSTSGNVTFSNAFASWRTIN
jgi:hypothetical protein